MGSYLSFLVVMSFTPGPNTICALSEGQRKGFQRSLAFNGGVFLGLWGMCILGACFATLFQQQREFQIFLKICGSIFLLYLAWQMLSAGLTKTKAASEHPLVKGLLMQVTNVKGYVYTITGLTGFTLPSFWNEIAVRAGLIVGIGVLGTLLWTLLGVVFVRFYRCHQRLVNGIVSLLLVYSAIELWL
ncbi:LysE family transporter [Lactobacillus sp. DCY120]|uniref:LysE family transporter n=1 Tax=Bombilactobacillus apium TaxID=2675299 RepID=A0A850R6J5_9LACO|nr:LysE family transporter [Bombilactobacillus apium]NVY96165.1 LysE family transporter [Bombilactobacillus apium]